MLVKMLTGPAKTTIVINSIFPFLAILAVALRLYARRLKRVALTADDLKADDYTIMAALVSWPHLLPLVPTEKVQVITVAGSIPYIYGKPRILQTSLVYQLCVYG